MSCAPGLESRPPALSLWTGQWLHAMGLGILLPAAFLAWNLVGRPRALWFWLAIAVPVAHQIFVWITWRWELRSRGTSRTLGFHGYLAAFWLFLLSRPLTLAGLALADRGTLGLPVVPRNGLVLVLVTPAVYVGYSLARYLGLERAAGGDHFVASYRALPLVERGAFRLSRNAMYTFGFLGFWALAVGADSTAAVIAAAFAHAHVWVHYFATERPDLECLHAGALARP